MAEIRLQPGELKRIKEQYKLDDDGSVNFESEFSLHRCAIAVPALVGEIEHLRRQAERRRLLIAKVDEYADRIWRSANSAYRKAGRELLEMVAIAREEEKK